MRSEESETLLSFVPHHLAKQLRENPQDGALGRELRFDAAVLFADISGFTAMSEALSRTVGRGAEELTEILNGFFQPTIDLVESFGGVVAKFGGDALTVLFPTRGKEAAPRRALACAFELQARMRDADNVRTSVGNYRLSLRVGLAQGPVLAVSVGDPKVRLEHVVAGRVLARATQAQRRARPGEVVLHASMFKGDSVSEDGSFRRLTRRPAGVRRSPLTELPAPSLQAENAAALYLHPSLVARVRARQHGFANEHRRVTVLFGGFEEFDYDGDSTAGSRLQEYTSKLVRVVDRYGGYLRQIHMGDKGSAYIVLFGAPIAHENDERRALRCALDLLELAEARSAIGVNTGSVFCGFVGSASRREYAVIGDAVNVAARLMDEAVLGEVIVSDETSGATKADFILERLSPLSVKGKSEPVAASRLHGVSRAESAPAPTAEAAIIGRTAELREIRARVEHALAGNGVILGITGEPGIGKSLLAGAARRLAAKRGAQTYEGACESFGAHVPYLPWREIWRGLLELPDAPLDQRVELGRRLDALEPGLHDRAPLLAPVLGVAIPETDLTRTLDPELRRESLHALLVTCLRRRIEGRPTLLLLEDCHWLDESSRELLGIVCRASSELPLAVICTYRRATDEWEGHPLGGVEALPHFSQLNLSALDEHEIDELVRSRIAQRSEPPTVPDETIATLAARAGGNPFYAEELVSYVAAGRSERELPNTVRSLVLARIDQLPDPEKTTLKVASVIGQRFPASWVWGSYARAGRPEEVEAHLQTLSRVELTILERVDPEPEYAFRHSTMQEVAYSSLAYSTRELLHEGVGELIERRLQKGDGAGELDLLAYHFGRSANVGKQRTYFRRAGDAARAAYANESAIDYYERLLPLLEGADRAAVMCDLAAVFQLVGSWPDAEQALRSAMAIADEAGARLEVARCRAGLGNLLSHVGSYAEAVEWLEQARDALVETGDRRELRRTLEHLSYAHFWRSQYEAARRFALEELELARELGDEIGESTANESLGLVSWRLGEHERAHEYFAEALAIVERAGYRPGVMVASNDLAGLLAERGDHLAAFRYLQRAFAVAYEIGARRNIAGAVANAGELSLQQGDYVSAAACFLHALRVDAELGRWVGILNAVGSLGVVCAETGHAEEAERLLDRAVSIAHATGDEWNRCFFLLRRAELLADAGRRTKAERDVHEALNVAREVRFREVELGARLIAARLRARRARHEAIGELETLVTELTDPKELADALYELWCLTSEPDLRDRAAALYEELHASTPNARFRRRSQRLTGKSLPDPPPLPPLSPDIPAAPALAEVAVEAERLSRGAPGVRRSG